MWLKKNVLAEKAYVNATREDSTVLIAESPNSCQLTEKSDIWPNGNYEAVEDRNIIWKRYIMRNWLSAGILTQRDTWQGTYNQTNQIFFNRRYYFTVNIILSSPTWLYSRIRWSYMHFIDSTWDLVNYLAQTCRSGKCFSRLKSHFITLVTLVYLIRGFV